METMIPLFPLPVVLFPGSALPLHIFERRYKLLINRSLRHGLEFGINFTEENRMADIGCTARVEEVLQRYEDGKMDIIVRGQRRYKLLSVDTAREAYSVGIIEALEPASGASVVDPALARETVGLYNALTLLVYKSEEHHVSPDGVAVGLSFLLAQKAGMSLPRRQQLLELSTENSRLELLRDYLVDVLPKLKEAEEIKRVIQGDGYV
jgi:ATP-dependent Lon protease